MRFLRVIRAVLWSLFGVRRRADAARDLESAPPHVLIATGVVVLLVVVVAIASLVRYVTAVSQPKVEREVSRPAPAAKRHGPVTARNTMEERVAPCAACHGATTEATPDGFSPRIAGKPAGYLFNQLLSFRDGRRSYAPMVYIVQNLSDGYLREIAEHFSRLELPYPPPEPASLSAGQVARARHLIEQGDSERGVPACVACHGRTLAGLAPYIPGIVGLPRQYLNAQFGGWRSGKLRSVEPDCMAEVARRLAPDDAPLLASWLSSQPVRAASKPESRARKLPLDCGSVRPQAASAAALPKTAGGYLAAAADCVACHTARGGAPFSGGRAIETPFGTVYSSNITPDPATGIGSWSRDDFWRALHEGRSKDGRLLYPAFPYPNFTQMTRADADAIYEYLRTLPAISRANTPHALRFPYSTQAALAGWRMLYFRAGEFQPDPQRSTEWNRGAYLVRAVAHCDACHSPRNPFGAVSRSVDLGGGLIPMQNWYAPPLTSSDWKTDEVVSLLKGGISPRAMAMGPMAEVVYRSTQHLTLADAQAIAAYLQSPANLQESRAASQPANPAVFQRGAVVYGEHCAQCHGDQGEGAYPAYPALARNPSLTNPVASNAIKAVLFGGYAPATAANPRPYGMPAYAGKLSEADIAAVLTFVRASWSNAGAPVSTLEIERYR